MVRLAVLGFTAIAAILSLWLRPPGPQYMDFAIWELATGLGFAIAAYAVCSVRPASIPGRLMFLVSGLLLTAPIAGAWLGREASNAIWMLAVGVVAVLLLRVVDDRPAPALMRVADAFVALAGLVLAGAVLFDNPEVGGSAAAAGGLVVLLAGWVQFELTTGDARRQVIWALLGVCLMVPLTFLVMVVNSNDLIQIAQIASIMGLIAVALCLPATIAIAATNPHLVDVRAVARQVSVIVIMLSLTLAVYIGGRAAVLAVAGEPAGDWVEIPLVALIAAGFHPAMVRVRASVDELLFGGRADPVATLSRLGDQLTAGSTPVEWLETLRTALGVPGITLVAKAEPADGIEVTPLRIGSEHLGDLVVTLPPDQPVLAPASRTVLELVAGPIAQALHATRLSEQLRVSRSLVVTALEEERRRMRRDLHDGLGPTLTGIAYSADAAANLARTEPDRALEILRQLRADTTEAIAEVRRIVYGLRPKALDELGLVGAVKQRVSNLRAADGQPMTVSVDTPPVLPELPAAVEVAAYRVAVEALTNVARHAGVNEAGLAMTLEQATLTIVVRDNGRTEPGAKPGVGMASMRERVEQIGGTFTVESGQTGTVVTADLPLSNSIGRDG